MPTGGWMADRSGSHARKESALSTRSSGIAQLIRMCREVGRTRSSRVSFNRGKLRNAVAADSEIALKARFMCFRGGVRGVSGGFSNGNRKQKHGGADRVCRQARFVWLSPLLEREFVKHFCV